MGKVNRYTGIIVLQAAWLGVFLVDLFRWIFHFSPVFMIPVIGAGPETTFWGLGYSRTMTERVQLAIATGVPSDIDNFSVVIFVVIQIVLFVYVFQGLKRRNVQRDSFGK